MAPEPPKVFISYSHDSTEHAERVLELSNRLRRDGVDCMIDQYRRRTDGGMDALDGKTNREFGLRADGLH